MADGVAASTVEIPFFDIATATIGAIATATAIGVSAVSVGASIYSGAHEKDETALLQQQENTENQKATSVAGRYALPSQNSIRAFDR